MNIPTENINVLWSGLIIEELIRHSIDYFCISPGSRSTPLTTAVARHPKARKIIIYDERSAAFHALGYAQATGKPAVLICTSGTAVANYLPAVIEAFQRNLPLIILSADRPPELRDSGANQTIDQVKLFGSYVRWFFDMPSPSAHLSPRFVLSRVDRLVFQAGQMPQGAVHLNCMFREPLAPEGSGVPNTYLDSIREWLQSDRPFTSISNPSAEGKQVLDEKLKRILEHTQRGLLLIGELKNSVNKSALVEYLQTLDWPVFADITSGLRLGYDWPSFIAHGDLLLAGDTTPRFDTVIHLGGRFVSKRIMRFLQNRPPQVHLHVSPENQWLDSTQTVTHRLSSDIVAFCSALNDLHLASQKTRTRALRQTSEAIERLLQSTFDEGEEINQPAVSRIIAREIPAGHGLFLANSLSVREMDMFGLRKEKPVFVAANRGASGIDGTISAATGFAVGLQKPVTLLIGDLALMHDLNALGLLQRIGQPVVVVLVNNRGGGIFHWLPIARFEDVFETYFATPHHFSFRPAAEQFDLHYWQPNALKAFRQAYLEALNTGKPALIEIETDRQINAKQYEALLQAVKTKTERVE